MADITYVPTAADFLFLAVVLDALDMAVTTRKPAGVIDQIIPGQPIHSIRPATASFRHGAEPVF
jgi:hypothetical protein